jgi:hypothetical protein
MLTTTQQAVVSLDLPYADGAPPVALLMAAHRLVDAEVARSAPAGPVSKRSRRGAMSLLQMATAEHAAEDEGGIAAPSTLAVRSSAEVALLADADLAAATAATIQSIEYGLAEHAALAVRGDFAVEAAASAATATATTESAARQLHRDLNARRRAAEVWNAKRQRDQSAAAEAIADLDREGAALRRTAAVLEKELDRRE